MMNHNIGSVVVLKNKVVDEKGEAAGLLSFGEIFQLLAQEIHDLSAPAAPEKPKIVKQVA